MARRGTASCARALSKKDFVLKDHDGFWWFYQLWLDNVTASTNLEETGRKI